MDTAFCCSLVYVYSDDSPCTKAEITPQILFPIIVTRPSVALVSGANQLAVACMPNVWMHGCICIYLGITVPVRLFSYPCDCCWIKANKACSFGSGLKDLDDCWHVLVYVVRTVKRDINYINDDIYTFAKRLQVKLSKKYLDILM